MSTSFSIEQKNTLALSITKKHLQRSLNKHSPYKTVTKKNTYKTPKTIVNSSPFYGIRLDV